MHTDELKRCFKCKRRKPRAQFYAHPRMRDGLLGKCKTCAKKDVRENYYRRHDQKMEYERRRNAEPGRRAARVSQRELSKIRYPGKYRARNAVSNAIQYGKLARQSCRLCGNPKAQAHHPDYRKPLDVEWLCFKCHREHAHGQRVAA